MNKIIERDENGRATKTVLDSKTASEMGKKSQRIQRDTSSDVNRLLIDAGYDDPDLAPERLRILAKIAVQGRSGAVASMKEFMKLTLADYNDRGGSVQVLQDRNGIPVVIQFGGNRFLNADWTSFIGLEAKSILRILAVIDQARRETREKRDGAKTTFSVDVDEDSR